MFHGGQVPRGIDYLSLPYDVRTEVLQKAPLRLQPAKERTKERRAGETQPPNDPYDSSLRLPSGGTRPTERSALTRHRAGPKPAPDTLEQELNEAAQPPLTVDAHREYHERSREHQHLYNGNRVPTHPTIDQRPRRVRITGNGR